MPDYRRYFSPGGTYFFTVKTERNAPIFSDKTNVRLLEDVFCKMKLRWPLAVNAHVVLRNHLHSIWSLPPDDADYPTRWEWLKKEFTKRHLAAGGLEQKRSASRVRNRRRGVWQRRFWEHTIKDEEDFEAHFDYVHWNPVKHGYVRCPSEWPHSSIHDWVKKGLYERNWGCGGVAPENAARITNAGE